MRSASRSSELSRHARPHAGGTPRSPGWHRRRVAPQPLPRWPHGPRAASQPRRHAGRGRTSPTCWPACRYLRTVGGLSPRLCAMPLMLAPASNCTRISVTSATRILLRPIDHLRLRCGHGRGHLLRTGRRQIVLNSIDLTLANLRRTATQVRPGPYQVHVGSWEQSHQPRQLVGDLITQGLIGGGHGRHKQQFQKYLSMLTVDWIQSARSRLQHQVGSAELRSYGSRTCRKGRHSAVAPFARTSKYSSLWTCANLGGARDRTCRG